MEAELAPPYQEMFANVVKAIQADDTGETAG